MASELVLERDGVRLAGVDFGGTGSAVLLMHGLAGHGGEWAETAGWLSAQRRVVALDARGHGRSERIPRDVSPTAHANDAAFAVEELGLGPVTVVGQSLGGQWAILLAAERPDVVRRLVVADAGPEAHDPAEDAQVVAWLRGWPVPFASRGAAIEFFGGPSPIAEAWASGLKKRDDGWWPRFDGEVMKRTLNEAGGRSYWEAWERIACPTLVVRAGEGVIPPVQARAMADRGADVRLVEIPGARHDLHLDRPAEWRAALAEFLD